MDKAPLAHDTSATAHDTAQTLVGQVYVVTTDTGMDGEVVHSLLALLDEGVAVDFPGQVFHLAVHLLQCLIDGHGTHRHRTVAHNPFASFVDVGTRRQVHQRVAAPFAAPHRLVHFLVNA